MRVVRRGVRQLARPAAKLTIRSGTSGVVSPAMLAQTTPLGAVPLRSVKLELDGFELHAERWSGGGEGHVLLLHGLGGNSVTWHGVAPELARAARAEVLAVDLPGFGRSRTA